MAPGVMIMFWKLTTPGVMVMFFLFFLSSLSNAHDAIVGAVKQGAVSQEVVQERDYL